jgi:hypothetical protein
MRVSKSSGFLTVLALGAIALFSYINPRPLERSLESVVKAVKPKFVADSSPLSEQYQIVEGSVYGGDTLGPSDL